MGSAGVRFGWRPSDIFGPDGLAWFCAGEQVRALGPDNAITVSGRIFARLSLAAEIALVETRMLDVHGPTTLLGELKYIGGSSCSESAGDDPAMAEAAERAVKERKTAEDRAFADKLAKRSPPHQVERAEIEKARKRTKARAPRIAMHIEDRATGSRAISG